jgi:hypothetical protein
MRNRTTHLPARLIAAALALVAGVAVALAGAQPAQAGPGPFYWIIAENSGKALMAENHSQALGARIVQMPVNNWGAQQWSIRHVWTDESTGQSARQFINRHSKHCIVAIDYGSGSVLKQDWCEDTHGADRREWIVSNKWDMWAGRPFTAWNTGSGLCMDIYGAWTSDYAPAQQYWCHGGTNQQFRLQHVPGT